jgi:hypothetical protein
MNCPPVAASERRRFSAGGITNTGWKRRPRSVRPNSCAAQVSRRQPPELVSDQSGLTARFGIRRKWRTFVRRDGVADFERGHADQKIGKRNADSLRLTLAVDPPGAQRRGNRYRMRRHHAHQFVQEALTLFGALGRIGAHDAMREFKQRDDGYSDVVVAGFGYDRFQELPRIPASAFGGDGGGRIEDQSQAGGSSGSR